MLFANVACSGTMPGAGTAARCTSASTLVVALLDAEHGVEHLAVVGQVDGT